MVDPISIEGSQRGNERFSPYPFGTLRILSLKTSESPCGGKAPLQCSLLFRNKIRSRHARNLIVDWS